MNVEEIPGKLRDGYVALKKGITDLYGQVKSKRLILDIHDEVLKGLVLDRDLPSLDIPLPTGACSQGLPTEVEAIGDLVGDLCLERGLIGARVGACLPLAASFWKVVRWPGGQVPDDGATELRLMASEIDMPWSLPSVYLDVQPLTGSPGCSLVVASPRQFVDGWAEVFELAGIQLQRLLPAQICEWQMLQESTGQKSRNPGEQWLLELGSLRSRLWVVEDGVPLADWSLPGQRGAEGLDAELRTRIDRCRRFWRQRRNSLKPQAWRVYGSDNSVDAVESDLRLLLGADSLERWQPAAVGANIDLRLAGLKVNMGWN